MKESQRRGLLAEARVGGLEGLGKIPRQIPSVTSPWQQAASRGAAACARGPIHSKHRHAQVDDRVEHCDARVPYPLVERLELADDISFLGLRLCLKRRQQRDERVDIELHRRRGARLQQQKQAAHVKRGEDGRLTLLERLFFFGGYRWLERTH